jgi:XTP/dITP diphosphohydrolase
VRALLDALGQAAHSSPRAFFRCAAVLALPDGRTFEGEGVLQGTIAAQPRGKHGFGFDPIFQLSDGRRLAELSTEEKNLLSHRARALNALEVHGAFDAALSPSGSR